jgi:hypothetical protein
VCQKLPATTSPPGDSALISEIVRRLVEVYRPERIYLFGSAARGDAGPDSDYDFMVVVSGDTPRETRETKAVFQALLAIPPAFGVQSRSSVAISHTTCGFISNTLRHTYLIDSKTDLPTLLSLVLYPVRPPSGSLRVP